jgi:hypothetical protein
MDDVNDTKPDLKPGDRVRVSANRAKGRRPCLKGWLEPGDEIVVDAVKRDTAGRWLVVYRLDDAAGTTNVMFADDVLIIDRPEPPATPAPCTCDRRTLLLAGCTCGHLTAVRAARRDAGANPAASPLDRPLAPR